MASPRISFSDNLLQTTTPDGTPPLFVNPCVSFDFDFDIAADASSEFFLADDLFLHGKLLPSLPPTPKVDALVSLGESIPNSKNPRKSTEIQSANYNSTDHKNGDHEPERKISPTRKSLWPFGRSSSLNDNGKKAEVHSSRLLRSKSAEPYKAKSFSIKRKNNGTSPERISNDHSRMKRYYYFGSCRRSYVDSVRVGLVLNVSLPVSGVLQKVFDSLLCSCGGKRSRKGAS